MKIALFAAVPEEVDSLGNIFNFINIGKENATQCIIRFMQQQRNEDFIILNAGTVGSSKHEVGTLLSISEIISAGMPFNSSRMMLDKLPISTPELPSGVLYSSDCFVSPAVFTTNYLKDISEKADCFDMESSALYTVAREYGKKYVSFKIVSDNLDVSLEVWQQRVKKLSKSLVAYLQQVFAEISKHEPVEFLLLQRQ